MIPLTCRQRLVPPPDQVIVRRIYLKPDDFDRYGFTRGCKRCEHDKKYGPNRRKTNHSESCRDRIEAELAKTPQGQARIEKARARIDAALLVWQAGGGEAQDSVAVPQGEMDEAIDAALAADDVVPSNEDVPVSFLPMPDADLSRVDSRLSANDATPVAGPNESVERSLRETIDER